MPTGPKGQKRPADVTGNAVHVMKVLTGETAEDAPVEAKQKAGRKGGAARAKALTPQQRSEIAKTAAAARWKKGD